MHAGGKDTLILWLIVLIAAAIVFWMLRAKKKLGRMRKTCRIAAPDSGVILELETIAGEKKLLSGLLIPKKDGSSVPVSLLMLHPTGVYVFTFYHCDGKIYGDDEDKMWTRSFAGGRREMFFNPVWQNRSEIYALEKLLEDAGGNCFYSYIVFKEGAEPYVSIHSPYVAAVAVDELAARLTEDIADRKEALTAERIEELYDILGNCLKAAGTEKTDAGNEKKVKTKK